MIATLTGIIDEKGYGATVVNVGGVGYGVHMTSIDGDALVLGSEVKIYIYENIKEDAHTLFGFLSADTKLLFEQLLRVKNVGPKVAMSILELGSALEVRQAIVNGDVKKLQSAKGVGKRAAEQVVVELRDKLGLVVSDTAESIVNRSGIDTSDEAMQALVALGYSEADAQDALKDIDPSLSTEVRIKQALKRA